MNNMIALSNFKHTVLEALGDLKDDTPPEDWDTVKLEALQILEAIATLNRVV